MSSYSTGLFSSNALASSLFSQQLDFLLPPNIIGIIPIIIMGHRNGTIFVTKLPAFGLILDINGRNPTITIGSPQQRII